MNFQVNLKNGVPADCVNETCTAGAGTLILEFGVLSHLLGDPVYEALARRTIDKLWTYKSNVTGLFGGCIECAIKLSVLKNSSGIMFDRQCS